MWLGKVLGWYLNKWLSYLPFFSTEQGLVVFAQCWNTSSGSWMFEFWENLKDDELEEWQELIMFILDGFCFPFQMHRTRDYVKEILLARLYENLNTLHRLNYFHGQFSMVSVALLKRMVCALWNFFFQRCQPLVLNPRWPFLARCMTFWLYFAGSKGKQLRRC